MAETAGDGGQGAPVGGHNYVIYSGMDEEKADAAIAFDRNRFVGLDSDAMQAALLRQHSSDAVFAAFCASRLGGDWGHAFGTLSSGADFDAIIARDYQQVQGFALLTAFAFVVMNLLVDLTYTFLDPRIRYA